MIHLWHVCFLHPPIFTMYLTSGSVKYSFVQFYWAPWSLPPVTQCITKEPDFVRLNGCTYVLSKRDLRRLPKSYNIVVLAACKITLCFSIVKMENVHPITQIC